ncbi:glycosyltransferase family 2 protein [Sphingobacterium cellulitidis]|uniref:glycosyltransferase family 2 protein n=1 Tax=Sphingobacterium cellulitidis TaxID=1768011 RepID=UPI003C7C9DC7
MFSIVIPLYNKGVSIIETIDSVLNQTFRDFELVVVNDGSTDNSLEVVKSFRDSRIRIVNKSNEGVSSTRNRGIRESKYEWIAFLDADDLWEPNHLETIYKMILEYPSDCVFATSFLFSDKRKVYGGEVFDNEVVKIDKYFDRALKGPVIWTGIVVVHKSVFDSVGVFNPNLSRGEDLDVWARIGKNYSIIKSRKITACYRVETENKLTNSRSPLEKSIVSVIDLKGKLGAEKQYYKVIILDRLKQSIKLGDYAESFRILLKHNFRLI